MPTKKTEIMSVQDQLRKELDTLKDRVDPPSGYMISTKGKTFTLPNGSADPGPLTCVILDWVTANTFFEGLYNPKDIQPPACFAIGRLVADIAPSKNSPKIQSDTNCHECDQNVWGSDPQGGKGKACKNTRRVLVVPITATEKSSPWILSVSPTGLKFFDKYVSSLSDVGTHPIEVVTDISFEPSESYPSLRFVLKEKHSNLEVMWRLKEIGQDILTQEPKVDKAA